jgi:hypothetical protein
MKAFAFIYLHYKEFTSSFLDDEDDYVYGTK